MNNYKFTYDENISTSGVEPLVNGSIPNSSSINNVSNYFYNLYNPSINKTIIEELDKILEYSNKVVTIKKYTNTINKDSWLKYKILKNISINNMTESIVKTNTPIESLDNSISVNIIQNDKSKVIKFDNKKLYDDSKKYTPLFNTKTTKPNPNENSLYLHKECNCNNEIEFLYCLLNCLFTSNNNYYIKKCERCNRYFLATVPNKKMCNRPRIICGKETICSNASKVFYKSKEYKFMFRMIENHLKHFYDDPYTNYEYIENIRTEFNNIKDKCITEDRYDCANECIEDTKELISKYL